MSLVIDNENLYEVNAGDGWTPRLHGDIFCSPLCGGRCKKVDFDRVSEQASALAAQLGGGWKPNVWENLGWHYDVVKGNACVRCDGEQQYEASIRFCFDGRNEQCISVESDNPRVAVETLIAELTAKITVLKRALMSLSLDSLVIQDVPHK